MKQNVIGTCRNRIFYKCKEILTVFFISLNRDNAGRRNGTMENQSLKTHTGFQKPGVFVTKGVEEGNDAQNNSVNYPDNVFGFKNKRLSL